ncbi:MAG: hypothetical protein U5N53_08990 [Mycobacterium sp.]|nr:hypothetical protein [Mycobacterium sp.]
MFGNYSNNPRNRESQIRSTGIKGRSNVRRVFDNSQCAHVWAQQTQDTGRSQNGNLYFANSTIYSYRSNWPLGVFTQLPDGRRAVVINATSYSNTTAGHLSDVRRALRGLDVVQIETERDVASAFDDAEHITRNDVARDESRARAFAALLDYESDAFRTFAQSLANPRKRVWGVDPSRWDSEASENPDNVLRLRLDALNARHDELMARAALCALDCPVTVQDAQAAYQSIRDAFGSYYDPDKLAKREKAAKARAKRSALINARKWFEVIRAGGYIPYKSRRRFQEALTTLIETRPESEWRDLFNEYQVWRIACECNQVEAALNPLAADIRARRQWEYRGQPQITAAQWLQGAQGAFYQESPTLVRRVGDELETSRGASCPFKHAVMAFLKSQECRATGTSWHKNGQQIRVGVFSVDSIDEQGNMRAGCHTLKWDAMLALAIQEVPHLVKARFPLPALLDS